MRLLHMLGRAAKALSLPLLLGGAAAFFVWHASHGERGLVVREQRLGEISDARAVLARAVEEREAAERRVNALRGGEIDRDQLEERARALLNLAVPGEIVIPYPPGDRLF